MRTRLKFITIFFFLISLSTYSQEPRNFKIASDPDYGITPQNPVIINTPYKLKTSRKTDYFIKGLRTKNGDSLEVLEITEIPNPNFKKPKVLIHDFINGEVINKGNGKHLKKFTLKSKGSEETYNLYINQHIREEIQVPQDFHFESPKC